MSVATLVRTEPVQASNTADILSRIKEPDVHLALWRRALPADLEGLVALDLREIDDIDVRVPLDGLGAELPLLLENAGYDAYAPALLRELRQIAVRFAGLVDCNDMRLRLEVVETDACRKFHSDYVKARLLMPLVGSGTQWREASGDETIHEMRVGEVGIFKGRVWAPEPSILHRSPPVAETGEIRLLFALNPADVEEAEAREIP